MENKQLPDGLKDEMPNIRDGIKQWSRFVAWSWTDYLAFGDDKEKNQQEEALKNYFRKILQDQARYHYAANSYGDEEKKEAAYITSIKIKQLLMGNNSAIEDDDLPAGTLTLPEIYEQLTGKNPGCLCDDEFMKKFHIEIVTDSFSGYIRDALDSEKKDQDVQYIMYLAYPPCPALSEATVTKKQLENWMQGKNEQGESASDYLPPSAYIPVSMT